jgi:hypothetical protein
VEPETVGRDSASGPFVDESEFRFLWPTMRNRPRKLIKHEKVTVYTKLDLISDEMTSVYGANSNGIEVCEAVDNEVFL